MMWFPPIDLIDASILLLMGEILILITFKLSSPVDGLGFGINKKRLENTAIVAGILFLVTVAIRILGILGITL
jgi:hypothetical protein